MGRAFKQHVQAEVARRLNETVLPHYNEMQERLKQYDQVRKGVMDKATFNLIGSSRFLVGRFERFS